MNLAFIFIVSLFPSIAHGLYYGVFCNFHTIDFRQADWDDSKAELLAVFVLEIWVYRFK